MPNSISEILSSLISVVPRESQSIFDREWVPAADRGALYVRPCLFSVDPSVRVKPPAECLFVTFTFPFTHYYRGPVDLLVSERYVRAFPGGTGDVKPAGNYAPALVAEREARALVHGLIVVDDGNLPFAGGRDFRAVGSGIVDQVEDIVLVGHCVVSLSVSPPVAPPAAARGIIMRKVVPCPSLDSSIMRPPSCWVTRL